jgi:hypothetical protein
VIPASKKQNKQQEQKVRSVKFHLHKAQNTLGARGHSVSTLQNTVTGGDSGLLILKNLLLDLVSYLALFILVNRI